MEQQRQETKKEADVPSGDIQNFLKTIKAKPHAQLTRFTIYQQDEKKEQHSVTAGEVLALVWYALHDEDKYAEKARTDEAQRAREKMLFDCLEQLRLNTPCGQGIRHALVSVLQGIYPGANIIQHFPSYLVKLTQSFLVNKLKELPEKFKILKQWINNYHSNNDETISEDKAD